MRKSGKGGVEGICVREVKRGRVGLIDEMKKYLPRSGSQKGVGSID